jgi:hypothetical protein
MDDRALPHDLPKARTDGVISESVGDDLVVYDTNSQTAHALSETAASVWELCDGERSSKDIAKRLGLEPSMVAQALAELSDSSLLDGGPAVSPAEGISRRDAAKRMAKIGGAALVAPLIYSSIAVQPALAAASCSIGDRVVVGAAYCDALPGGFGTSNQGSGLGLDCCASHKCYQNSSGGTYWCVNAAETCSVVGGTCNGLTVVCCSVGSCGVLTGICGE